MIVIANTARARGERHRIEGAAADAKVNNSACVFMRSEKISSTRCIGSKFRIQLRISDFVNCPTDALNSNCITAFTNPKSEIRNPKFPTMTEPEIARRCPTCGASIREVALFCPQCGNGCTNRHGKRVPLSRAGNHFQNYALPWKTKASRHRYPCPSTIAIQRPDDVPSFLMSRDLCLTRW